MPGSYSLYNYFSNAPQLLNVLMEIENYKILFSMFLIISQLVTVNTTLRLHSNDNEHQVE